MTKKLRKLKKPRATIGMASGGGLPACDTEGAEGAAVDSGMRHGYLVVVARGLYVDTVECERCKREFKVAARV